MSMSSANVDSAPITRTLAAWHRIVQGHDGDALQALLSDDVVFHSPVVHTPQRGRALTGWYLAAALQVLGNPSFRYVREVASGHDAVLEFEVEVDGVHINGVDMIRCDDAGRIVDFKVLVRPLKAIQMLHQKMAAMLETTRR